VLGCVFIGELDWIPAEGGAARFVMVLLGFGAIALLCVLPLGIALETAGRLESGRWTTATILASRAVGLGVPLLLLGYAAWLINAPESVRALPFVRYAALTGLAVLIVAAAIVSVQELGRWNRQAAANVAAERVEEDRKADETRRAFAALTDADPLLTWYQYSTYASPDDVRLEAMRRIAARSNLDAELIAVLDSENPLWSAEGLRFVAELPLTPSAALAAAVRRHIDAYAASLVKEASIVTYDGDKRLDYYEPSRLRDSLAAARRLADVSRVDLRPQVEALRQAVALYPKSDMARSFPREAAEAQKHIAARLAAQ
jgi:hypothetical protein